MSGASAPARARSAALRLALSSALLSMLACVMLASGHGDAQSDGTTLLLWHAYGETEARGLEAAVDAFEARRAAEGRPVRVEVTAIPFGAYASKLQAAIPVGNGPDVFVDAHDRLASYVEQHLVRPLEGLPEDTRADLDPAHLEALTWEGALWGVPLSAKSLVLYINVRLGDPAALEALEDFEGLRAATPRGSFPLAWELDSTYASAALFHAFGARHIDDEGRFALEGEGAERALGRMQRLVQEEVVPSESSGDLVRNLFRSGRAVAAVSGPWLAPDLPPELRFEVRPLPRVRSARNAPMVPFSTIESVFFAARDSEAGRGPTRARREAARDLAVFLAGPDGARVRALEGGHVVTSRGAWRDPALADRTTLRAFRDAAAAAMPMPTHPHMSRVFGPVDRAIRKVLRAEMAPAPALAEAAHRFTDETRPPPPPRDPTWGLVALSSALVLAMAWLVRQLLQPGAREAVVRSLPAYAWVAHAFLAILVLVVTPLAVGAGTSFFAGRGSDLHYVGLANYADILSARGGDLFGHGSFYTVLAVTVLWTVVNVASHVGIGVALALALSRPLLRLKAVYRVLLILPWAVPSYVTALAWRGMFHRQLGAVNAILDVFGVEPVSWFAHFSTAFTANVATNVWLGFPFMMVVTMGALTSIPKDLYEAAEVDGASPFEQFRHITLPMLGPALLPAVAMGAVWTFNMFNVVFLVSAGEPDGSTEILVSEAYRWAFTRGHQTGYAAAYAVLIFGILVVSSRWIPGATGGAPRRDKAT
jgi:arabinogalactan oligomer/maltooligosaccharide transport system permease protein